MPTMNISLPEPMKQFVEEQVSLGGYSTASEYIRQLVRADQKHKAKEKLEELMLEGLNSGDPIEVTPAMWQDLRAELRARSASRKVKSH